MKFLSGIILLVLSTISTRSATWYVDSSVSSSGNGQSWGTAWKNISNISGVSAGDTVYISGGPSGSSQTYALGGSWSPAGGSSGNPITYQIGQDSAHNGTAYFTGSGTFLGNTIQNLIISGDAGDNKRHFTIADPNSNVSQWTAVINNNQQGNMSRFRLSYVNFGMIPGNSSAYVFYMNGGGHTMGPGIEIDHTWGYATSGTLDGFFQGFSFASASGYDQNLLIHDNAWFTQENDPGYGSDGIKAQISGASYYNNLIVSVVNNGPSYNNQHADGFQLLNGQNYVKLYGNWIHNYANYDFYGENTGTFAHWQVYNNVFTGNYSSGGGGCVIGADGVNTFSDITIMNNVMDVTGQAIALNSVNQPSTFTGCLVANNVYVNPAQTRFENNSTTPMINNVTLNSSQAAADFISFNSRSTNSNFHLLAAATSLINQGTNLSSFFTTDRDGNARPGSGAWDIGAYEYGSGGPSTNPSVTVSPTSLDFGTVLTNTTTNLTVTVRNSGGGTLTGTAGTSTPFKILSGGTYSLGSNQSQTVTIQFAPTSVGTANGTVSFPGGNGGSLSVSGTAFSVLANLASTTISASFNASAGSISSPFTVSGGFISQSVTTGVSGSGSAVYGFNLAAAGSYVVAAQVNAPDTSANSFYVNIDAQPTDPTMIWDIPATSGVALQTVSWRGNGTATNNQFVPQIFNLSAGPHQLIIRGKEAGTQLGPITISIPPPTPRIVSGP